MTLEQGATKFKDDQFVSTADRNFGNRTTTLFDQRLMLNSLSQAYGVRGDSTYTKALATAITLYPLPRRTSARASRHASSSSTRRIFISTYAHRSPWSDRP